QVHAAETRDGRPVVVKIQYPGVDETVEQDLKNVDALLQVLGRIARDVFGKTADVASLRDELEERLREELDYRREAANLARFRELFADDDEIEIPEVEPALSTRRVLTMTRLEGYPLADILAPGIDQEMKDWVARKYYRIVWRQLFRFSCLHTDPHPGNYRVTHHPHLGMLDFGSVRVFPDAVRRQYVALARGVLARDRKAMLGACRELGFLGAGDPEAPLAEVLEIVLEPLLADRDYDPAEYRTIDKAMRVANLVVEHRLFQSPGHRVFLMRALIGLESLMKQLGTVANWRRLLEEELPNGP
ncbi:MAG: ABC1 kinase family protein, partial [Candidatus Binatia bacterium]